MDLTSNAAPQGMIDIRKILSEQNFSLAIPAGIGAALLGALAWAFVTVATGMQAGLMAVAVGYLVGYAIRAVGHGIDPKFGYLGAACALMGCLAGNALSAAAFYARLRHVGFGDALNDLDAARLTAVVNPAAHPMDLLFYAIAIYEGYRFSFKYRLLRKAAAAHQGIVRRDSPSRAL